MRAWLDIANPPQVQYLLPFKEGFERAGCDVVVTASDVSITLELLRSRGVSHLALGAELGGSFSAKATGSLRRALRLRLLLGGRGRPSLVLTGSRSSILGAALLRAAAFAFCDYEHVELTVPRLTGAFVVHPDVIEPEAFTKRGVRPDRLVSFPGLKESFSLMGIDVAGATEHRFPQLPDRSLRRVLVRPPGERTHYYEPESKELTLALLEHLAARPDAVVVYAAREPAQREYPSRYSWVHEPVILEEAVPFVSLLKAVDAVVSSGGTMLREAAHLGLPAYSIFQSEIGAVDRYLESIGRLTVLSSPAAFASLDPSREPLEPLPTATPESLDRLVRTILERAR